MTAYDAATQTLTVDKAFSESIDITGVILTKMEGDSGGVAALSIKEVTNLPIKFIGTG